MAAVIIVDPEHAINDIDMPAHLQRADTKQIKGYFQHLGRVVACSGVCAACCYFILSSILIWYSSVIPDECNRPFDSVFFMLGVWNGAMGVVSGMMALVGREVLDSLTKRKLAQKYRREDRQEEAESQDAKAEEDVQKAYKLACCPGCLYMVAQIGLLVTWFWGAFATWGSNFWCWHAETFFYWLLLIEVMFACCSLCSGSGSMYGYRRM
eukprot:TRINITY_DN73741_c0_g1_i1.p2 TRINITY_DN73741_c0_g1~~TRINITY_DN73741_c0_g1_i1.p2  ORF type:complete len:210 (+),score=56.41 TRINITY_DN73741_c0_g1_i1:78-707(+)